MPKKTENDSGIADRLRVVMSRLGLNQVRLAALMETSSAYVNNMLKEGKQPGSTILSCFKKNLPELNLNWLITGEGEMFCEKNITDKHIEQQPPTLPRHAPEPDQHTPPTDTAQSDKSEVCRLLSIIEHSQINYDHLIELTEQQAKTIDKLADVLKNATNPKQPDDPPPTKLPTGDRGLVRLHRRKSKKM